MTDNTDPRVEAAAKALEKFVLPARALWMAREALAAADAVAQAEAAARRQCPHSDHLPSERYMFCPECNSEIDASGWIIPAAPPRPDNADLVERLRDWFNHLPDGGLGKEHFDALVAALRPTEGKQG